MSLTKVRNKMISGGIVYANDFGAVGDGDVRSFLGQRESDDPANALCRAGDDGDLVFDFHRAASRVFFRNPVSSATHPLPLCVKRWAV